MTYNQPKIDMHRWTVFLRYRKNKKLFLTLLYVKKYKETEYYWTRDL